MGKIVNNEWNDKFNFRYNNEGFYDIIAMGAGLVQAGIFVNFFVMFMIKRFAELKIETSV